MAQCCAMDSMIQFVLILRCTVYMVFFLSIRWSNFCSSIFILRNVQKFHHDQEIARIYTFASDLKAVCSLCNINVIYIEVFRDWNFWNIS